MDTRRGVDDGTRTLEDAKQRTLLEIAVGEIGLVVKLVGEERSGCVMRPCQCSGT
jgi:hypothetical protein